MSSRTVCWAAAAVATAMMLCAAGCNRASGTLPAAESAGHPATTPPAPTAAPAAGDVPLRVVDQAEFEQALKSHRGQVVAVDFWATWCEPCVKMFPHMVALHRQYADRGLTVISMSFNEPGDEAAVRRFLAAQGATYTNFISRYGTGTESAERFAVDALPHVRLYDRQGRLAGDFAAGSMDVQAIDRDVAALLASPAP